MTHRAVISVLAAAAFAAALSASAAPVPLELHGLKVMPPVPFSAPEEAGLDAVRVVHPPAAKAGGEKLAVTAVTFPKDSGMNDAELLDYVKTTFLGASEAGKAVERTFLGKTVKGRALEKKIPAPSLAEVYVVTKKGGDKVVVAFVFVPSFAKEAEAAIAAIAASMKE